MTRPRRIGPPRVAVCVPVRDDARHLDATLASIAAQTLDDWEAVVSINASRDGSAAIACAHATHDPRIRVIVTADPLTPAAQRNLAVYEASAALVKLLDVGDELSAHCLHRQVGLLADPAIALALARRDLLDAAGTVLARGAGLPGLIGRRDLLGVARAVVRHGGDPLGEAACALFRRADYLGVGGLGDRHGRLGELDLWLRLLRHGGQCYGTGAALARVRVRPAAPPATARGYAATLAADPTAGVRARDRAWGVLGGPLARARGRARYAVAARRFVAAAAELEQNQPA